MDARQNEIKVGLAVLISIAILIGGIIWGKGYSLRTSRYPIQVEFNNVGGLESGTNVLANGVVKGKVTGISLIGGKVYVKAVVDKNVTLFSNYRITIESPTVMAGKVLALEPGDKLPLADVTKPLRGQPPLGVGEAVTIFENLSEDIQTALHNLDTLILNLNKVAGDSMNQRHVSDLLTDASGVAHQSNEWLSENHERLTGTLTQLEDAVTSMNALIHSTEARLQSTMNGVDSTASQISSLTSAVRDIVNDANSDKGTLGKLINDPELYTRMTRTLGQADSLIKEIRAKGIKTHVTIF
jgi:phospholipid/cholesterol/gamma-HCH transport system substrate-binding protein